jgi:hypothetical protein
MGFTSSAYRVKKSPARAHTRQSHVHFHHATPDARDTRVWYAALVRRGMLVCWDAGLVRQRRDVACWTKCIYFGQAEADAIILSFSESLFVSAPGPLCGASARGFTGAMTPA